MKVNQKKLHSRVRWLFDNRTTPLSGGGDSLNRWRYVPQAFGDGPGWGVYDRLNDRFLDDREVVDMPLEHLQTATHLL